MKYFIYFHQPFRVDVQFYFLSQTKCNVGDAIS